MAQNPDVEHYKNFPQIQRVNDLRWIKRTVEDDREGAEGKVEVIVLQQYQWSHVLCDHGWFDVEIQDVTDEDVTPSDK